MYELWTNHISLRLSVCVCSIQEKNKDIYTLKDKCPFRITKPKALFLRAFSFYICYLSKRLHHEISFVHTWVRNRKACRMYFLITVHKYIYINYSIVIYSLRRFLSTPHQTLYFLCYFQYSVNRQIGFYLYRRINKNSSPT